MPVEFPVRSSFVSKPQLIYNRPRRGHGTCPRVRRQAVTLRESAVSPSEPTAGRPAYWSSTALYWVGYYDRPAVFSRLLRCQRQRRRVPNPYPANSLVPACMYGVVTRNADETEWSEFDRAFYEVKDVTGRAVEPLADAVNMVSCFGDNAVESEEDLLAFDDEGTPATRNQPYFDWTYVCPTHDRYREGLLDIIEEAAAVNEDVRLDDVRFPRDEYCHVTAASSASPTASSRTGRPAQQRHHGVRRRGSRARAREDVRDAVSRPLPRPPRGPLGRRG